MSFHPTQTPKAGPPPLAPAVDDWLETLRHDYRQHFPDKLALLQARLDALANANSAVEPFAALLLEVHRLHGSAGTFGMHAPGEVLAAWESYMGEIKVPMGKIPPRIIADMRKWLQEVAEAVEPAG